MTPPRDAVTLTLTLPMPPNMANSRMHWRVRNKKRQEYYERVGMLRAAGILPKPLWPTPEIAEIHVRMFVGAMHDHDNAMARLKWAVDFLVTEKYITNDDPKHLKWSGFPEQIVKRDGNYRVEITLANLHENE